MGRRNENLYSLITIEGIHSKYLLAKFQVPSLLTAKVDFLFFTSKNTRTDFPLQFALLPP